MQKIKDFKVGEMLEAPLVVVSATARETKAKKPYLQLELYDGTDTIPGNFWDWAGKNIPAKNAILNVTAQVTEYLGTKQLNIKSLSTNTDRHLSEFAPNSGVDVGSAYLEAYRLGLEVKDDFLRNTVLAILEELQPLWCEVPGAKGVHHAFVGGTLIHSVSVAKIAKAISDCIPEANKDLCVVGGLLHDVGKLYTYKLNGITIDMTYEGMLYDHIFMGAEFVGNYIDIHKIAVDYKDELKAALLRHIILSHHGALEFGSPVTPACIEAHIVAHADGVDASTQQVLEQSRKLGNVMWTDRIYTLNNRQHLTTQYVREVFSSEE